MSPITSKKEIVHGMSDPVRNIKGPQEPKTSHRRMFIETLLKKIYSGAPAAEGRQAEPHTHIRELKGAHELIFSCVPWLAVLLVGAYARRRRRRWSRATWRLYSNNRLTETCSLGLPCTSLMSDIHVMIN